jgi:hypothetical protein
MFTKNGNRKTPFTEKSIKHLFSEFSERRAHEGTKSDSSSYWDSFVHIDFMNYFGFYIAIRTRIWELRNDGLRQVQLNNNVHQKWKQKNTLY